MSKASNNFKEIIKNYLDQRAKEDKLFAVTYQKENKNLDGCINYIFQSVQKSGCNGFADEEIFDMAVHYYDEDSIGEKGNVNNSIKVVVNHKIDITEQEIAAAKQKALDDIIAKETQRLSTRTAKKKPSVEVEQIDLFS